MEKSHKILVTGGTGVVGSYMKVGIRLSHTDLDVTNLSQVEEVIRREKPSIIIHLAALTDMKQCEEDHNLTYMVNTVGAYNIALMAREVGAKVIYISTNAVFDGSKKGLYVPTNKPRPINVYGHSKYLGELAVLGIHSRNLVVRTSWIFGGGKKRDRKFIGKIMSKLQTDEALSAVSGIYGTPTYGKDLALAIEKLLASDVSGTIHITNGGKASRHDMAMVIREAIDSKSLISQASFSSFGVTGNVLQNEALDSGEYSMRPWREALREYIKTEWK